MAVDSPDQALCTLSDLHLRMTRVAGGSKDETLAWLIVRASAAISQYCGRRFQRPESAVVEYYDGGKSLWLNQWPVISITSIYDDASRTFGASSLLTPYANGTGHYLYRTDEAGHGRIETPAWSWGRGFQNIKVTYIGGYDLIPADVVGLCAELVGSWFAIAEQGLDVIAGQSIAVGGGSMQVLDRAASSIPPHIKAGLRPWTRTLVWG